MSSEQYIQVQESENNFEAIYQRRIMELEQKVNKYCAQYDALMNLLPIGNHLTTALNFQKDFNQISSKIDSFDSKISTLNTKQIEIDNKRWEQSYKDLQNILKSSEKQLHEIEKLQKQEENFDDSRDFEQMLNQKVKTQSDIIQNKLAHYKNNIQLKKYAQSHKTEGEVSRLVEKNIKNFYGPIIEELEQIEDDLEVAKLKIPLREVKKFHEFNYHRLLNEILETNQNMEQIFALCQSQQMMNNKKFTLKVEQVQMQIQSLHYQIEGSRNKCLNDLLTDKFINDHNIQFQNQILKDFDQLRNNLQQLKSKLGIVSNISLNR